MKMLEGYVYDAEQIGTRPGMRYRVRLVIRHETHIALVYMIWDALIEQARLHCWFHDHADCQCCQAVESLRKEAHIDSDRKDD